MEYNSKVFSFSSCRSIFSCNSAKSLSRFSRVVFKRSACVDTTAKLRSSSTALFLASRVSASNDLTLSSRPMRLFSFMPASFCRISFICDKCFNWLSCFSFRTVNSHNFPRNTSLSRTTARKLSIMVGILHRSPVSWPKPSPENALSEATELGLLGPELNSKADVKETPRAESGEMLSSPRKLLRRSSIVLDAFKICSSIFSFSFSETSRAESFSFSFFFTSSISRFIP